MTNLVVLSRRNIDSYPAMCCITELENVFVNDYSADLYCFPNIPKRISGSTVICVLLGFFQLSWVEQELSLLKSQGNRVILYVFDCWDMVGMLSSRKRKFRDRFRKSLRLTELVDNICIPLKEVRDALSPKYQSLTRHVPLGVDCSLVNGYNDHRPIAILAYGSQPPELTRAIAEALNGSREPYLFHHTDHQSIARINDCRLHRMHFWKLAQWSQIAITYDPTVTSPDRVPVSIVSQRFFESLAAGCVLAGKRPTSEEASELLDWPDSVIDLPEQPRDVVGVLLEIIRDPHRIATIRERNVAEVQARHDWRQRIPLMLSDSPLKSAQ